MRGLLSIFSTVYDAISTSFTTAVVALTREFGLAIDFTLRFINGDFPLTISVTCFLIGFAIVFGIDIALEFLFNEEPSVFGADVFVFFNGPNFLLTTC